MTEINTTNVQGLSDDAFILDNVTSFTNTAQDLNMAMLLDMLWFHHASCWVHDANFKVLNGYAPLPNLAQPGPKTAFFMVDDYAYRYDAKCQVWQGTHPTEPIQLIYLFNDGVAVYDNTGASPTNLVLTTSEVLHGKRNETDTAHTSSDMHIMGAIRDIESWQTSADRTLFTQFSAHLAQLMPTHLELTESRRITLDNVQDCPVFTTLEGRSITLLHMDSMTRQLVTLAYLRTWLEHKHHWITKLTGIPQQDEYRTVVMSSLQHTPTQREHIMQWLQHLDFSQGPFFYTAVNF